jgi:hypothetical protein
MDFLTKKQTTLHRRRERNDNVNDDDEIFNSTPLINKLLQQKNQSGKMAYNNNASVNFVNIKRPRDEQSQNYYNRRPLKKRRIDDFENICDLENEEEEIRKEGKEIVTKEEIKGTKKLKEELEELKEELINLIKQRNEIKKEIEELIIKRDDAIKELEIIDPELLLSEKEKKERDVRLKQFYDLIYL